MIDEKQRRHSRKYYIANKEKFAKRSRDTYILNRDIAKRKIMDFYWKRKKIVFDYYGNICACCGETGKSFLTIDHVNNDGFKERHPGGSRVSGCNLYYRIIKANFPDTYQILCMNCNHSKRINKGICEHNILINND